MGSLHTTVLFKSTPSETNGSIVGMDVCALECAPLKKYCVTVCVVARVSLSLCIFFLVLSEMRVHSRTKSCTTYKMFDSPRVS